MHLYVNATHNVQCKGTVINICDVNYAVNYEKGRLLNNHSTITSVAFKQFRLGWSFVATEG